MYTKYPRTFHLPWSEGVTSDDKVMTDVSVFEGQDVVVTEKMDGENTTMYRDCIHARSIDSGYHPSRSHVKNYWAQIKYLIPEGVRICGENVYAEHSIAYDNLKHYFLGFGGFENDNCLSWTDTLSLFSLCSITSVPILFEGKYDERHIRSLMRDDIEGYVVRLACSFAYTDFSRSVGKFVRKDHVQTDKHWTKGEFNVNKLQK